MRAWLLALVLSVVACKNGDETSSAASPPPAAAQTSDGESGRAAAPSDDDRGLADAFRSAIGTAPSTGHGALIPEGATLLAGADVAALVQHPLWTSARDGLGSRQRTQLQAATDCGVGPDKWRSFVIGVETSSRNMAMVVEAVGIGRRSVLECLVEKIGTFTLAPDAKSMSDETGGGIVLSDDAIAFATPAWMNPLRARIAGNGRAAVTGILATPLGRTDLGAHLWFASTVPDEVQSYAMLTVGSTVPDVAGAATLSPDLALRVSIEVPDPASARTALQSQWDGFRSFATNGGVPDDVARSVKFVADDKRVVMTLSADQAELGQMLSKFRF